MFFFHQLQTKIRKYGYVILAGVFIPAFVLANSPEETGTAAQGQVDFDAVVGIAENMSKKEFDLSPDRVPGFLLGMSYDQWRDIRFKTEHSLWRGQNLPFEVQFFHPGAFYNYPVEIMVIEEDHGYSFPFSPELFDYGQNAFREKVPENLGYAGFRIHYNINNQDYKDEVAVFLGASYFRAVGKEHQYGLSARGLAIDTGLESGEEFPLFRKFWLQKPQPGDTEMVIYALLDSVSYTGAYRFLVRPGAATVMEVDCRLFPRNQVKKLGIAPLTSMFYFGENTHKKPEDDFRPEVHDSDGLMVALSTGEWIWQPLQNPQSLHQKRFEAPNPGGFGLLQRDLAFHNYQDLEAHYNRRPSAWVKPRDGDWDKGGVELILIPSGSEVNDNIVAFWVPENPGADKPLSFSYDILWYYPYETPHGGGYVVNTFTSSNINKNTRTFLIDFKGGRLDRLDPNAYPAGVVTVSNDSVSIIEQRVQRNPYIDGWRMVFTLRVSDQNTLEKVLANKSQPINVRAFLRLDKDALTETWVYSLFP